MAPVEVWQWPFTAPATRMLVWVPGPNEKPGDLPRYTVPLKLALKELILRGAYRLEFEQRRSRSRKVRLVPQDGATLPPSLESLDAALRPWAPAEIPDVIRRARKARSKWWGSLGELAEDPFRKELFDHGLITEHKVKPLGLLRLTRYTRTESGDAWAADGVQCLERLETLPAEVENDPQSAARFAAVAGALTLMVPAALASVARLHGRRRSRGGDLDVGEPFFTGDGSEVAFDPFDAVGDLFETVLDESLDSIDAGIESMDAAFEEVAGSIDSAVDSGVDAGADGGDGGDDGE